MVDFDNLLEQITEQDILAALPKLRRHGNKLKGECPGGHSHAGSDSFQVSLNEPVFICHSCGARGNYIHLFEFIEYGRSSQGAGFTDTFAQTITKLSFKYGISEKQEHENNSERQTILDILDRSFLFYNSKLKNEHYDFLEKQYGFYREFVNENMIGYGAENPVNELKELYSESDILKTGLFYERRNALPKDIYFSRYVFPYRIKGKFCYSAGRATNKTEPYKDRPAPKYIKQLTYSEKFSYVSPLIKNQIIYHYQKKDSIVIAEGIPDYYAAKMHGYNAASAVTTRFKKDDHEQLVHLCKDFDTVYIANDSEDSGAGIKGAMQTAEYLTKSGKDVRIIEFPRTKESVKMDLCDFLRDYGKEEFDRLMGSAKTLIQFMIKLVPADTEKIHLKQKLKPVFELLSFLPKDLIRAHLRTNIHDRFKMRELRPMLSDWQIEIFNIQKDRERNAVLLKDEVTGPGAMEKIKMIETGQAFHEGKMYYTVTRKETIEDENGDKVPHDQPFIVSSDREFFRIKNGIEVKNDLLLSRKFPKSLSMNRWDIDGKNNHSVHDFIANTKTVNPAELFKEILKEFHDYIYFKRDGQAEHLALVVMASYVAQCVDTVGYVHILAEKRSGKTTALTILEGLGFNAVQTAAMTPAAMYRIIEIMQPLLLIDEAENFQVSKEVDSQTNMLLNVLKIGYKRGASVYRCEGEDNTPTEFSTYGIKVFAGTRSIDNILEDRAIIHEFKRAPGDAKIKQLLMAEYTERWESLRNKLYIFGLEHGKKISSNFIRMEENKEILDGHGITFRERELWAVYLAVAQVVDASDDKIDLFNRMVKFAGKTIDIKKAFAVDGKKIMVLEQFYLYSKNYWIGKPQEEKGLITNEEISAFIFTIKGDDDLNWFSKKYLIQYLRGGDAIDENYSVRWRVGSVRLRGIKVDMQKLLEHLSKHTYQYDDATLEDIEAMKNAADSDIE